ncbi:MAG: hypothetical protein CTY15_02975 [Methylocystis sp.]|nr:MAG: hypothetical protein CTY15_02975 [Methylocystis sp.]
MAQSAGRNEQRDLRAGARPGRCRTRRAFNSLPHVFTLFTQASGADTHGPDGLGIGLALARRMVELHAGKIEAQSAGPGQGSTFVVRLPIAAAHCGAA